MEPGETPRRAATPPLDPSVQNANGDLPPTEPDPVTRTYGDDPLAESAEYREARQADDLQRLRRTMDRVGPVLFVIAWFAALAVMYLAIIANRLRRG